MVAIKSTIPAAAIAIALASTVASTHVSEQQLEARNPTARLAGSAIRAGGRAVMRAPVRQPVARIAQQASSHGPVRAASGVTGKQVGMGLLGGKLAGGALVGFGSLGAQAADEKLHKRGLTGFDEVDELVARNPAVRAGARLVGQTARTAIRPNVAARVSHVARPMGQHTAQQPSSVMSKLKGAGAVTGIGLTAGVGEYFGGKHMGNANDRLAAAGHKRELDDPLEELVARYFADEVEARDFFENELDARDFEYEELMARNPALVRGASRAAGGALRAAARTAVHHPPPAHAASKMASGARTLAKGAAFAGAAGIGGYVEGGIQNLTPETAVKLKADPKKTISAMLPNHPFRPRDLENILAVRALLDMIEDELD